MLHTTGKYYMDLLILSISSHCDVVPTSRVKKKSKIISTYERIMADSSFSEIPIK